MYSYERRKTAAQMDFYTEWRDIVDKHRKAEEHDFAELLKKASLYLKSVGYDLDLRKSWLSKYHSGSDGFRMQGELYITERAENTTKAETAKQVEKWVQMALDMHGSAKNIGKYTWVVDITAS